jgi:Family of unknown function (DUF5761)
MLDIPASGRGGPFAKVWPEDQGATDDDGGTLASLLPYSGHARPLARAFFGDVNVRHLDAQIRYRVNRETGSVVSSQIGDDLLLVMRSVYLQYGDATTTKEIPLHVRELDEMVMDYAVPNIVTNLRHHLTYLRERDQGERRAPHPMDRPRFTPQTQQLSMPDIW